MKPIIIAGPCAVESEEQIIRIASKLKQLGIDYLRGGAFKPRTNPDDFQGLGELGIEYLIKAKQITGLPIVTELMSIEQVKKYAKDIDIILYIPFLYNKSIMHIRNFRYFISSSS